jgi:site-specific recombinase XerD
MVGSEEALLQACRDYADRHSVAAVEPRTAVQEFLDEKHAMGRDENYHRAARNILDRLVAWMPERVSTWTPAMARDWTLSLAQSFAPVTVNNHIRMAKTFGYWCTSRNYIRENPFANTPTPQVVSSEPEFLKVDQIQALLETAQTQFPEAVPYLALNAFAGLRSSACARLAMDQIDFEKRGILLLATIAKNKRRVYLDGYEPNLWVWLDWAREHAPTGFSLTKRQWDALRGKVAEAAGVKMPHNALRHSFATYHVALHGDAGKTATLMTHRGNVAILYEHYKGNASRAEAEGYFGIEPA